MCLCRALPSGWCSCLVQGFNRQFQGLNRHPPCKLLNGQLPALLNVAGAAMPAEWAAACTGNKCSRRSRAC